MCRLTPYSSIGPLGVSAPRSGDYSIELGAMSRLDRVTRRFGRWPETAANGWL